MKTRHNLRFIPAAGFLLLLASGCGAGGNSGDAPPQAPEEATVRTGAGTAGSNVIIITVDTLRADRLGAYGSATTSTPILDALAAESVRFDRAYAPLPKTNPSLCTLMTGRYPSAHGVRLNGASLPDTELTLAELLQAAGYRTAAFISNPVMHSRHGLAQGFQRYDQELPDPIATRDSMERTAGPLVDAVLDWSSSVEGSAPLFLWVHFIDPHGPYTPPGFSYDDSGGSDASRMLLVSETNGGSGVVPAYQTLPDVNAVGEYIARYDAEVDYMDQEVGRLLEGLRRDGILEDAILLFTADHGESLGDHDLWFQHGSSLYDPQIRIPLLISGPGISPAVRQETVGIVDVVPTVLDLLGLRIHEEIQGTSLGSALRGEPADGKRIIHAELDRLYASIRGTEKLIWNTSLGKIELYRLDTDPAEATDISGAGGLARAELASAASRFAQENTRDIPVGDDEETLKVLKSLGYLE